MRRSEVIDDLELRHKLHTIRSQMGGPLRYNSRRRSPVESQAQMITKVSLFSSVNKDTASQAKPAIRAKDPYKVVIRRPGIHKDDPRRQYPCYMCSKKLVTMKDVARHIIMKHKMQKPHNWKELVYEKLNADLR